MHWLLYELYLCCQFEKSVLPHAGMSIMPETCDALEKEVNTFKRRERLILDFKVKPP